MQIHFVHTPHLWILLTIALACYAYKRIRSIRQDKDSQERTSATKGKDAEYSKDAYLDIEPLQNFDLETSEPIKIRPFKPKYFLTMAIENTTLSDLLAMDKTYSSRIALRRSLISEHKDDVLAANPRANSAVSELYTWITSTYLPRRFPSVYTLTATGLRNQSTGETLPLTPGDAEGALALLGSHIDTDFLFLLPSSCPSDDSKYKLEAFITCFPSGFKTRAKLNLKLADIHAPVPGYAAKLEKSMDRFFATLPVGKIVRRANWSVTTHRRLFCLQENHGTEEEVAAKRQREEQGDGGEGEGEEFDINETVLRCERQTLHRLPESGALVFAFKTYLYDVRDLREEGSGPELADAIEGLGKGNAEGMRIYKREVFWGEKVKAFLRGEGE